MNPSNDTGQGGGAAPVDPDAQAQAPAMPPMTPQASQPNQQPAAPGAQAAQPVGGPPMTFPLPPAQQQGQQGQAQDQSQIPVPAGSQIAPQNDVQPTTNMATPTVVDDGDLIEKEWVNKAKQIVDQNRNDPYKQSEELTVFRADYMKKRYNKNIKVDK